LQLDALVPVQKATLKMSMLLGLLAWLLAFWLLLFWRLAS
jgi:hypothetical protein